MIKNKRFVEIENEWVKDIETGDEWEYAIECISTLNQLSKENKQLKKDVEYWKQVASQYSNEINVFKHKEQYKTECKDIYYSSD